MDLWLRAGDTSLGVIVSQVADKIAKSSSGLRNIWCDFAQCILVTMVLLTKGQSSSGSTGFELGFEWLNLDCEIHLQQLKRTSATVLVSITFPQKRIKLHIPFV